MMRTVLICCRRATTVVTAAPLHRHFAAAPLPSERRERTLTAKEKLGKKMAVQRTLDSFRRRRKPIAARLESAKDEKRKGIPLKPGSPSWKRVKRQREENVAVAERELAEMDARIGELERKLADY